MGGLRKKNKRGRTMSFYVKQKVQGKAKLYDSARVYGKARVYGGGSWRPPVKPLWKRIIDKIKEHQAGILFFGWLLMVGALIYYASTQI